MNASPVRGRPQDVPLTVSDPAPSIHSYMEKNSRMSEEVDTSENAAFLGDLSSLLGPGPSRPVGGKDSGTTAGDDDEFALMRNGDKRGP